MTEALIDALVTSGLTRAQAHAVFRLNADVHCRRAFDRAIACRDLVGSGFLREDAENAIDRALASQRREGDGSAAEGPRTKTS